MAELLLEIGLEEIPARMIPSAERELAQRVADLVIRERCVEGELVARSYSTPRRLTVHLSGLGTAQADNEEQLSGPSWAIAFRNGEPTPAAHAFAKKAGVSVEALAKTTTAKGEYVTATVRRTGRSVSEVLTGGLAKEIAAIAWAKGMYWRPGKPERYVRPVHWLLALLDDTVLPIEFAGVSAAGQTYGHRILHGPDPVKIKQPSEYLASLEAVKVLANTSVRRDEIRKALDSVTRTVGNARWREDEPLVQSLVHLTEWPCVILGRFSEEFLALPEEVLVTVMRDHQKYFAVEDGEGKLAPYFLTVLNTEVADPAIIRHGNERVLRARFNDARFFWEFDQRISLDDRVELLKSVTFQKDLGSYHQKTERTQAIALALAAHMVDQVDAAALERAALLAKVDLTTELVKEFTELQGIVGGLYARAAGEKEAVAAAISAQYRPAFAGDAIPETVEGRLLGLAERIGTIVDMFGLGLAPTGSKDPYALRRAANAVVSILVASGSQLELSNLIEAASAKPDVGAAVHDFFAERVEFYLREVRGFAFDVVKAVLAPGFDRIAEIEQRAAALSSVRGSGDFAAISAAFKRSKNILLQAAEKQSMPAAGISADLLVEAADKALYEAAVSLGPRVEALRLEGNYVAALEAVAELRVPVDRFFNSVMVMAEDAQVRANRLALLALIVSEFSKIADFSEIVTPGA